MVLHERGRAAENSEPSKTVDGPSLREVLDHCVTRREKQPNVSIVAPLHDVQRRAVVAVNFEDLRVPVRLADVMSFDDQPVTH
jgi:hypothetical protein